MAKKQAPISIVEAEPTIEELMDTPVIPAEHDDDQYRIGENENYDNTRFSGYDFNQRQAILESEYPWLVSGVEQQQAFEMIVTEFYNRIFGGRSELDNQGNLNKVQVKTIDTNKETACMGKYMRKHGLTRDGFDTHTLLISEYNLDQNWEEIVHIVIHGLVHLVNQDNLVPLTLKDGSPKLDRNGEQLYNYDCASSGKHNEIFKATAEKIGLKVLVGDETYTNPTTGRVYEAVNGLGGTCIVEGSALDSMINQYGFTDETFPASAVRPPKKDKGTRNQPVKWACLGCWEYDENDKPIYDGALISLKACVCHEVDSKGNKRECRGANDDQTIYCKDCSTLYTKMSECQEDEFALIRQELSNRN